MANRKFHRGMKILNFPALAEADDPLGRPEGAALWPARFDEDDLREIREGEEGEFWFSAMYQQRPTPRGGAIFHREWFDGKYDDAAPVDARRIRWWDRAASQGKGDYTAGVLMARKGDTTWIEHVERGRWGTDRRDARILAVAESDAVSFARWSGIIVWAEQEPGSAGVDAALAFVRMMVEKGFAAHSERSTGSKEVRADAFSVACSTGKVRLVRGAWNKDYLDELTKFTGAEGGKDDQVDASSGAFNKLASKNKSLIAHAGGDRPVYVPSASGLVVPQGMLSYQMGMGY